MFQKKEIETLVLPMSKYWLIIFSLIIFSLLLTAFFVFLGLKYPDIFWVMLIFILLSLIIPALFVRLKINLIANQATMHFSEEFIEIKTSGTLNDRFSYSEIQFFSVSNYDVDHASTLKFILKNGVKRRYIFFRQYDNDQNTLNNVLLRFSSYNTGKIQDERIQISPSFFLTKPGKIFVTVTGLIILVAIIIQVIYKPKATPVSILAVLGGYLQAKGIQMNDKKILDEFRNLNGSSID